MKILSLHCDYIKYKPLKKAIKQAEEKRSGEAKECLTILIAVEKNDNNATELIKNIKEIAKQVKCKHIVLYPYAHLSSNLAAPEQALKIMKEAEQILKKDKDKFKVTRAPFGYYKQFELKCKGHPLSELSREIKGEETTETYNTKQLLNEISKSKLDTSKLKENDHRILGQQMDLFSFNETAPGMVFWHNNGMIIRKELIKFWREEHEKADYQEIKTPQILDKRLWQISGHWEKYRDNIFLTDYENKTQAVKPMNCPGGILVFKSQPKSYKELPLRIAELGEVHRQELSGVLGGLFRVIQFTQDDAHIYCTDNEKQIEKEIIAIINLVSKFYKKFKFPYHVELSTMPKVHIGDEKTWKKAEKLLARTLKKKKMKYKLNKGDGAFYGPKIDFHIKDSLGRTWQTATIQLDFAMPERFNLTYKDKDNKEKPVVMLHRTVYGSLERFLAVLLEHTSGHLPTWLAPIQARLISFTKKNKKAVEKVEKLMKKEQIRVDTDLEDTTVSSKIRAAEIMKIPYIIVLGDKEQKSKTLAVRHKSKIKSIKQDKFIKQIKEEIINRK